MMLPSKLDSASWGGRHEEILQGHRRDRSLRADRLHIGAGWHQPSV